MATKKRTRIPLSDAGLKRLQVPVDLDEDKYAYRWINNAPGRLEAAEAGGYEKVPLDEKPTAGEDVNGTVSQVHNRGSGQRAFLMRIPRKMWTEDQEAKEQLNKTVDRAIDRQEFSGRQLEEAYVPEGGGIKSFTR
jgi:hypothetical protein